MYIPEVGLLDHMLVFFFGGTSILFFIMAVLVTYPQGFLLFTSSPIFVIFSFSDNRHLNRCEVIAHCGFDSYSLMISDAKHLFIDLLATCISSLEKVYCGPLPIL